MITLSLPAGRHTTYWARGDSVTAEDIHDALRRFPARFVVVPREFSGNEHYRLDVLRLNDPATQARQPPETYRNGEYSNMFYTADALLGVGTAFVWRKIIADLRDSADSENHCLGEAIVEQLGNLGDVEPEAVMQVELSSPTDWMKRVFAAAGRIALSDDD